MCKMPMTTMLILLTLVNLNEACPSVTFSGGIMVTSESTKLCKFQLNGANTEYDDDDIKQMRFYGFIMMRCEDCSMGLVSPFNGCDDCIWCFHNEGVGHCHSIVLPIIISVFITSILTLLIVLICWKTKVFKLWLSTVETFAKNARKGKSSR